MKFEDMIITYKVDNFAQHKKGIIESINSLDTFCMAVSKEDEMRITSTNYWTHASRQGEFVYDDNVRNVLQGFFDAVPGMCDFKDSWHQIYYKGDFHGWHTHPGVNMAGVMYVQTDGPSGTEFNTPDGIYRVPAEEGTIIGFPASFMHRSPPHEGDSPKIVISFNWNWGWKENL